MASYTSSLSKEEGASKSKKGSEATEGRAAQDGESRRFFFLFWKGLRGFPLNIPLHTQNSDSMLYANTLKRRQTLTQKSTLAVAVGILQGPAAQQARQCHREAALVHSPSQPLAYLKRLAYLSLHSPSQPLAEGTSETGMSEHTCA